MEGFTLGVENKELSGIIWSRGRVYPANIDIVDEACGNSRYSLSPQWTTDTAQYKCQLNDDVATVVTRNSVSMFGHVVYA
jgi:hypothetical protein